MKMLLLRQRLDPRRHLAVAVGWAVFAIITTAAVVGANWAALRAEDQSSADAQALLSALAARARAYMVTQLSIRRAIVQTTAIQIVASADRGNEAVLRHLEPVRAQFPEFLWLGASDDHGRITAATGRAPRDASASTLPWFVRGLRAPMLGEVEAAPQWLVAPGAPATRVLSVGAPLRQTNGPTVGVLGAYLSWTWFAAMPEAAVGLPSLRRGLQIFVTTADGTVLIGPPGWPQRAPGDAAALAAHGAYLVGEARAPGVVGSDPAWHVAVRQPADTALAPARHTRNVVFGIVLTAGLLAAAAAFATTRVLMRRLSQLSRDADAVRRGERTALTVPAGKDEIARIGHVLAELVTRLQQEKQSLQRLNSELDARVAERTARIERLAQESRQAAVTRERLRMARGLHDTLSHSLMALLTQIRLIRKLHTRMEATEIDAELDRAEAVAASGLAEARAVITQMRDGGVRDVGLGTALTELLARFGERSGIEAALEVDAPCAAMADEHA